MSRNLTKADPDKKFRRRLIENYKKYLEEQALEHLIKVINKEVTVSTCLRLIDDRFVIHNFHTPVRLTVTSTPMEYISRWTRGGWLAPLWKVKKDTNYLDDEDFYIIAPSYCLNGKVDIPRNYSITED